MIEDMQRIKQYIKNNTYLSDLIIVKGVFTKITLSRLVVNRILNFMLRQNTSSRYGVHYRSTVIGGQHLKLLDSQKGTLSSLANSSGCYIQAGNGIEIGEGTLWGPNVLMISANHDYHDDNKSWQTSTPIIIGKNCWIGGNVSILPGVKLGDNTVVGAGSVVTKSFTQGQQLIAGNPAKIIKDLK